MICREIGTSRTSERAGIPSTWSECSKEIGTSAPAFNHDLVGDVVRESEAERKGLRRVGEPTQLQ